MTNADAADTPIQIVAGRRAPYTQVGDWVALSGATAQACRLYWLLKMHVNGQRADAEAWPSRASLAIMLRLGRADRVDRYVAELTELDAIDVQRRFDDKGAPMSNLYLVHDEPPSGYAGPRTLADRYVQVRERRGVARKNGPQGGPQKRSGGSPQKEAGVARKNGPELDEVELDEEKPPPPPPGDPARLDAVTPPGEEETAAQSQDGKPGAGVLAEVCARTGVVAARQPGGQEAAVLARAVAAALGRGWSAPDLVTALSAPMADVKSVAWVLGYRLRNLPPPPVRVVAVLRPACDRHRGQLAGSCGPCRAEQIERKAS